MARCALDNLRFAYESRGGDLQEADRLINSYGKNLPNLGWIRLMRNDLIHDRLVPLRVHERVLQIDRSLLPVGDGHGRRRSGANGRQSAMPWDRGKGNWMDLRQLIESIWDCFPKQINRFWIDIEGKLGAPPVASSGSKFEPSDAWASGSPKNPQSSRDMFGPAGGSTGSV